MCFKPLTILMASAGLTPVHPYLSCSGEPTSALSTPELVLPQLSRKETPPLTFSGTLANAACSWPPLLQVHTADLCSTCPLWHTGTFLFFIHSFSPTLLYGVIPPLILPTLHLPLLQFMRLLSALFSKLPWSFCLPAYQPLPLSGITTKLLKGDFVPVFTFLIILSSTGPSINS